MKRCPVCGREWPLSAKFCPFDGAGLETIEIAEEVAPRTTAERSYSPSMVEVAETLETDQPGDTTVMDAEPLDDEAPTRVEVPSIPLDRDDEDRFSETSWFMAASDIEEMEDVEESIDIDEDKYRKDKELADEIRRQFTLDDVDE